MALVDGISLTLRRRLPVVLQTEAAECGLACLAMIAAYHGQRIDLRALRRRFSVSLKGSTLASMIDVANRLDLSTRPLRLELEHLGHLALPCILHWRMNHFVVLKAVAGRRLLIHDPAGGERKLTLEEASDAFTGVALELWPNPDFRPGKAHRAVRLRDLVGRVRGLFQALAQILLLAVVLEIFALVSPLILQWVIDHALVTGNRDLLTTLAVGFGLLVVLQQSVSTLRAWVIMHFGTMLNVQWHANTFARLLTLPLNYFEKRHPGDIISRFRSIDVIQKTLTTSFIEAVMDGLMASVVLLVLFLYSPTLTWICLAALMLYVLSRSLGYRPLRLATQEQIVHAATQESHFLETVRGVRAIKLFQRENERRSSWLALLVDQVNAGLRAQKLQILFRLVHGVLFGLEHVLVIWLGAMLVLDGAFSVGMLMAFLAYRQLFASRVSALVDRLFEVKMLQVQGERLADIVMEAPESAAQVGRPALPNPKPIEPSLRMRALRFRYGEHEPYVLDRIELAVEAGESVAIVGPSGCGKTTLLHLLLGVLQPTEGEILIGNVRLAHIGTPALRGLIGSVTQNDVLFAGSIADNISFFDPRPDQERVQECARLASIHEEILCMPMGYDTMVGYMGSVLSGGQQQRVLLARALYRRPRILVLDEATSHLDMRTELMVNAAVRSLKITRIIVAHRPQTVRSADRIVTLYGGKIVDERPTSPQVAASNQGEAEWLRGTGRGG
jgi:ATP-binding cassette, subfamily B, bacterial CvaB/MchF/RaxB